MAELAPCKANNKCLRNVTSSKVAKEHDIKKKKANNTGLHTPKSYNN